MVRAFAALRIDGDFQDPVLVFPLMVTFTATHMTLLVTVPPDSLVNLALAGLALLLILAERELGP